MYKVQEVAKIAGVSVRTLHHYDSVGLLKPSNIGSNRYRYYNDEDLKLLQHILFFKELGFSLKKIQEIVADGLDPSFALTKHAELLRQKKERIEKLIENAETTQLEYAGVQTLSNEERFAAFSIKKNNDDIKKYTEVPAIDPVEPAETPAVDSLDTEEPEKEEENLEEINREGNRIYDAVSRLMHLPPETDEVQKEIQAYYRLLDRFYNCTPKMFRGLADLYVSDSRFTRNIDQHGEGLANYLQRAMYIFADQLNYA